MSPLVQVMNSPWIVEYTRVPQTPLYTGKLLRETEEAWTEVQDEMTRSLATMRVDYDQVGIHETTLIVILLIINFDK